MTPAARRRTRLAAAAAVALAACGGAAWWYSRPRDPVPEPPVPDLSRAEPEVAGAVAAATSAVRATPRDAAAWGKLGMVLRAHDFDTESVAAFRTAASLNPDDYRWPYLEGLTLVLFEPGPGLERLRRSADLAPPDRPGPRLRTAEILVERGDLDGAAALAKAVADHPRAQLVLARVAAARGDWDAVLDHASACGEWPECRRPAALLRGEALAARGDRPGADVEFRRAAGLPEPPPWPDPDVARVKALRVGTAARLADAATLLEQQRVPEALALLRETTQAAPNNPAPALFLGQTLVWAGDPRSARQVLEDFVVRFPDSVEGWFHLGVARFQTSDIRLAADAFRQVTRLKPDHAMAHFNLGHCHLRFGDRPAARAEFEEALRCRPDHHPSREALAKLDAGK